MTPNALKTAGADSADAAHAAQADEENAARTIAAARKLLKASDPALIQFFDALFAGAPPEDVARYTAQSLADLAALAFAHSAVRLPGESHVEIVPFTAQSETGGRGESVLVAVNDDSPFLFDSLVAELSCLLYTSPSPRDRQKSR